MGRQLAVLDRLHARRARGEPDAVLHVLCAGDVRRDGHCDGGEPVHAVHLLRGADLLDLSAGDAQRAMQRRGGQGASISARWSARRCVLFLPGIIGVAVVAGSTTFTPGGLLAGKVDATAGSVLLLLLVFGAAKAALMPLHGWLPKRDGRAGAGVGAAACGGCGEGRRVHRAESVGLHFRARADLDAAGGDLAAVDRGGDDRDRVAGRADEGRSQGAAGVVDCGPAGLRHLGRDAAVGGGLVAGGLHMVFHAVAKITLFMCAGAIYVATGASKVSEMGGLGRRMPIVFVVLPRSRASRVIGLPPMAGMWSKFLLMTASFGSREWLTAAAMIVSSLLGLVYLVPVAMRALAAAGGRWQSPRAFIRPGGTPGAGGCGADRDGGGRASCCSSWPIAVANYLAPIAAAASWRRAMSEETSSRKAPAAGRAGRASAVGAAVLVDADAAVLARRSMIAAWRRWALALIALEICAVAAADQGRHRACRASSACSALSRSRSPC